MTGKGFVHSTAALLTGIGTLLAALVALAVLLVGEGVLFKGKGSDPPNGAGVVGTVESEGRFGREGTTGLELDGEKGIVRNPKNDADILFYETTRRLSVFSGAVVVWEQDKQPSFDDCAKLLETHGKTGTLAFESGDRFCVRSSKGRTALLAVISEGEEYRVFVWKRA